MHTVRSVSFVERRDRRALSNAPASLALPSTFRYDRASSSMLLFSHFACLSTSCPADYLDDDQKQNTSAPPVAPPLPKRKGACTRINQGTMTGHCRIVCLHARSSTQKKKKMPQCSTVQCSAVQYNTAKLTWFKFALVRGSAGSLHACLWCLCSASDSLLFFFLFFFFFFFLFWVVFGCNHAQRLSLACPPHLSYSICTLCDIAASCMPVLCHPFCPVLS